MIPRYRPVLDPGAWLRWWRSDAEAVRKLRAACVSRLPGGADLREAHLFASARMGLYVYFRGLRESLGGGTVLLSAQLCPIVARVVAAAGLPVRFVDTDDAYPTPSARQFAEAIDRDTIGVVVAPLYGYVQPDWAPLLDRLDRARLVLDLAQGPLLEESLDAGFFRRADAVAYSFGLGKGLDTGGGLVLARAPLPTAGLKPASRAVFLVTGGRALALRALMAAGLYGLCPPFMDAAEEKAREPGAFRPGDRCLAPEDLFVLWDARLDAFRADLERARRRAQAVGALPRVRAACRDLDVFAGPRAAPLRQILRLRDAGRRPAALAALRCGGVDCAPAGEPLPAEYSEAAEPREFPNARRFRDDALRLPFLGRLSEAAFDRFQKRLEAALV